MGLGRISIKSSSALEDFSSNRKSENIITALGIDLTHNFFKPNKFLEPIKEIILKNDLKQNLANSNFLTEQTQRLVDENNFAASEFVNKNLIVHTFSKILLENNETLTIVISEISNEIELVIALIVIVSLFFINAILPPS